MELSHKAHLLALKALDGHVDIAGIPSIKHVQRVARNAKTFSKCLKYRKMDTVIAVAFLHDVVEDSNVSFEYIYNEFGATIGNAVALLTRAHGDDYELYISKIKFNEIARIVKLADLRDNINRLPDLESKHAKLHDKLQKRYSKAWKFLGGNSIDTTGT